MLLGILLDMGVLVSGIWSKFDRGHWAMLDGSGDLEFVLVKCLGLENEKLQP